MRQPGAKYDYIYAPYYETYVALVPEADLMAALSAQRDDFTAFLRGVPEPCWHVAHAPYTWTFCQAAGHLIDTERIFGYRALRIARGDTTPLPGFEQDPYVANGGFDLRDLPSLADEWDALRASHVAMFRGLPEAAWGRKGVASNAEVNVAALAAMMIGHVRHHGAILRKRLDAVRAG